MPTGLPTVSPTVRLARRRPIKAAQRPRGVKMPAPATASTTDRDGRWLSLGPASRLLGIDPDTLRRWADQGRVASWTTPGGHRRFDRSALERLLAGRRSTGGHVLSSLGGSPQRLAKAYRRYYAVDPGAVSRGREAGSVEADREAHRRDGRLLIAALIAYLDASPRDAQTRERLEGDAEAIVDDQARRLAAGGTSLDRVGLGFRRRAAAVPRGARRGSALDGRSIRVAWRRCTATPRPSSIGCSSGSSTRTSARRTDRCASTSCCPP